MKTIGFVRLITWAFALLFPSLVFANSVQNNYVQDVKIKVSVAPESEFTAFEFGTALAPVGTFVVENQSLKTVILKKLWVYFPDTVTRVFMEDGEKLVSPDAYDYYDDEFGFPVSDVLFAGEKKKYTFRANIFTGKPGQKSSNLFAILQEVDVGNQFNSKSVETPRWDDIPFHSVVQKLPRMARLTNSSSLRRLQDPGAFGFVVTGDKFSRARFLMRVAGPSLQSFGIKDVLMTPHAEIFDSNGKVVGGGIGWSDILLPDFAKVGAFPFDRASWGNNDMAEIVELPPGAYTISVRGFGLANLPGTNQYVQAGEFLVEIYELSR